MSPLSQTDGRMRRVREMRFIQESGATASLEWLAVAVVIIAVIGAVLWGVFGAVRDKLAAIRDSL
jgi:hypothetical protein